MRRGSAVCLLAILVAAAVGLVGLDPAEAEPPPPEGLFVNGGDMWRPDNDFRLDWQNPANPPYPIVAVRYRVRDAQGAIVVPQQQIDWATNLIEGLTVPGGPGLYTAEVWLVDQEEAGQPAAIKLRFDDARPAQLEPLRASGWLGRAAFPYTVRLSYPRGALPASGIGGYAIALDSAADSNPCAAPARCTSAETNLNSGLDGNALTIAGLPEGATHIHAVAVSGSGMKSVLPVHGTLRVDLTGPVTRLAGVPNGWTDKPVTLTATATDTGSGMEAEGQTPVPFTALRIDDGLPRVAPGGSVSAAVIAEGIHRVAFYARDAAANVDDGSTSNGQANPQPSTAIVRIDRSAPSVAFASSEDPLDPELIHVRLHDPLSGPDRGRGSIGVREADSADRFEELRTEPTPTGFRARWDSEAYPPGRYEFRAIGYDAAGNSAVTMDRASGVGMVLPNPVKVPSALETGFGERVLAGHRCARRDGARRCQRGGTSKLAQRRGERVVPFGRGALFSGRLSAGAGVALEGMEVKIVERLGGPIPVERISAVRTGSDGAFALRLAPGPSREVTAVFEGSPSKTRAASRRVRLGVRSDVSLRVSSSVAKVGGRPLVFRGKVAAAGGEIPPEGKTVQLQFRLPGVPWTEFRTIQTDRKGRFSYKYRFADDDSRGTRFQFRAYASAQGDWPYEPGGSEPVAVRGR
ncbi:MAG: hypothetical protein WD827_03480 [Solirubrobacterales bacterium]